MRDGDALNEGNYKKYPTARALTAAEEADKLTPLPGSDWPTTLQTLLCTSDSLPLILRIDKLYGAYL